MIGMATGLGPRVLFGGRFRLDPLIATRQLVGLGINLRDLISLQSPNPEKSARSTI
jgi:hypothetical protein